MPEGISGGIRNYVLIAMGAGGPPSEGVFFYFAVDRNAGGEEGGPDSFPGSPPELPPGAFAVRRRPGGEGMNMRPFLPHVLIFFLFYFRVLFPHSIPRFHFSPLFVPSFTGTLTQPAHVGPLPPWVSPHGAPPHRHFLIVSLTQIIKLKLN